VGHAGGLAFVGDAAGEGGSHESGEASRRVSQFSQREVERRT